MRIVDCIEWWRSHGKNGYGLARVDGKTVSAHRLAYTQIKGPIPAGLVIDHLCRNRSCVNPDHLEAVTQGENLRRGRALFTCCPSGHPYADDNLAMRGNTRTCRACNRIRVRTYNARPNDNPNRLRRAP